MSKTLTTDSAKHIAKQHGLAFTYSRAVKLWILHNPNSNLIIIGSSAITTYSVATPDIGAVDIEEFYEVCANIACNTVSKDQMNLVVDRAVYSEWQDRLEMARLEGKEGAISYADIGYSPCTLQTFSADKQVHEVENGIRRMMEELTEQHGSYSEYKAWMLSSSAVCEANPAIAAAAGMATLRKVIGVMDGVEEGATLTIEGDSFVMFAQVGHSTFKHTLAISVTKEARLLAHWTGFLSNVEQARKEPDLKGYTEQYYAERSTYMLHIHVKPGTDLDSEFTAWCTDEKEYITVKGWLFSFEKVEG